MLFHVKRKTFYFLKQVSGQDKTGSTAKQNSKSPLHSGIELFLDEHINFHTPLTHQFSFHEPYMGHGYMGHYNPRLEINMALFIR